MGITDILTIYMNGMPTLNREKGTASMIMSTVTDGAYDLPILPTGKAFTITKNINSIISGNFEGKSIAWK